MPGLAQLREDVLDFMNAVAASPGGVAGYMVTHADTTVGPDPHNCPITQVLRARFDLPRCVTGFATVYLDNDLPYDTHVDMPSAWITFRHNHDMRFACPTPRRPT